MNRVTSSSNAQSKKLLPQSQSQPQPQPPETKKKKEKNLKRERFPATKISGSSSSGSSSSNVSGCSNHRFLLSHSFSSSSSSSSSLGVDRPVKSMAKTSRSAPVVCNKPLIRKKPRIVEETKLNSKPQRCKPNPKSVRLKDRQVSIRVDDSIAQISTTTTTPVSKLGNGSEEATRVVVDDEEKTPPVQASVSPEIQFGGGSSSAQSQACYATGHLLSGVSDKRKCKPKGILTVGKGKILNDSDEFDEGSILSLMPPSDASVHWILSPCDEEKETFYRSGGSSDLCNISSGRSLSPMRRRMSSSLSPNELSRFRRFIDLSSCEGVVDATPPITTCKEDLRGVKTSPLSVDTLGSENVIQTPESNSSFDDYLRLLSSSQGEIDNVGSDLESLTTTLQSARLSPTLPQEVPNSSSFKFDSLATSSESIDFSQFQRTLAATPFSKEKGRDLLLQCSGAESITTDGGGLICSEDSNWMACYKN